MNKRTPTDRLIDGVNWELARLSRNHAEKVARIFSQQKRGEEIIEYLTDAKTIQEYGDTEMFWDFYNEIKDQLNLTTNVWSDDLDVSLISGTKTVFSYILKAFVSKYGEATKSRGYNGVIYSFEKEALSFRASIDITGCKLVEKTVHVPAQITPAHDVVEYDLICEE